MIVRAVAVGVMLLGFAFGAAHAADDAAPSAVPSKPDHEADLARLITQLGADSFQQREQATRQLLALGEKALDAVAAASRSDDPEVRRRAKELVRQIQHLRDERLYRAIRDKIKDLPLDQFVDHLATRKEFDRPENWERLHELAKVMTTRAGEIAERKWTLPALDYKNFPTSRSPMLGVQSRQKIAVEGLPQRVASLRDCVLVSSGAVEGFSGLSNCIVFINGDLKRCTSINNCFVFCNGNLGRVTGVRNSIILCTGDFAGSNSANNDFFQVKSVGRHTVSRQNVYLNLKEVACTRSENNKFIPSKKGPLQTVRFFDLSRLGLTLSSQTDRVRIDKVQEDKPFARAGLRAGDLVIGTEHGAILSAEELRKILRRRLAGESITLKVRRGDKTVECKVKLAD